MKVERTHQPRKPQPRRTRWQEYVISKAYYLDNERNRLCDQACQDTPATSYVKAATTRHLAAARRAAGVEEDGQTPIRFARRDLLVNAWTGASVEGAFVNLLAADHAPFDPRVLTQAALDRRPRCSSPHARWLMALPTAPPQVRPRTTAT